ncbi:hypothetical protein [Streptomyces sp. NPDC088725]|uniref:hypothetical protein n=1 Tax=Streptomyces sp. NPDC088725 TaxID=3365873 RepID=UPI00381DE615
MVAEKASRERARDRWWVIPSLALVLWIGFRLVFSGADAWPAVLAGGLIYGVFMVCTIVRRQRETPGGASDPRVLPRPVVRRRRPTLNRHHWWAFPLVAAVFLGTAALWLATGEYAVGGAFVVCAVVFLSCMAWMNLRTPQQRQVPVERSLRA